MIPFKMVSNNIANGDIVLRVTDVKFDVDIPDTCSKNRLRISTDRNGLKAKTYACHELKVVGGFGRQSKRHKENVPVSGSN